MRRPRKHFEDTDGNVFGGFTPGQWESRVSYPSAKGDHSQRSFLFTLKNPQNLQERRFALRAKRKEWAILSDITQGPSFHDISVVDNANTNRYSAAFFDDNENDSYVNDTGINGKGVFTRSKDFQVREIEVFKITDSSG
jgi:hypothetical protein